MYLNLVDLLKKRILELREVYLSKRLLSGAIKDYAEYREIYGRVDMCRVLLEEIEYCQKQLETGDIKNGDKRT